MQFNFQKIKKSVNINIDYSKDSQYDDFTLTRFKDSYFIDGDTSPQTRLAYVSAFFGTDEAHSQRLYDYASKLWFGYASPIASFDETSSAMPISCYLNKVPNTKDGLVKTLSETAFLSMAGGGVGTYMGMEGITYRSVGAIPHAHVYSALTNAYRQKNRRGSVKLTMDISHPDIEEFLNLRNVTGDPRRRAHDVHTCVNIPNSFMDIIARRMSDPKTNTDWNLVCPATGDVVKTVCVVDLWKSLLTLRAGEGRGEPFIHFIDNTNDALSSFLKDKDYKVITTNLCTEILQKVTDDVTAVCCLSSINMAKWDEVENKQQFVTDLMEMLDNVLQYFIDFAPANLERAIRGAREERSVGLGVMGFHSMLQEKNVPFASVLATSINYTFFKKLRNLVDVANNDLGARRGSPPLLEGTGRRFTMTTAIAPTATNAILCGNISPSIEPWRANAFRQDTLSGVFIQKNKVLDKVIRRYADEGKCDYDEAWLKIVSDSGSVGNLDFLTEWEKNVFACAEEIPQTWLISHAADRQTYIDQGQSLNLFTRADVKIKTLHDMHYAAWFKGLKTLYYLRIEKVNNVGEMSSKIKRVRIEEEIDFNACPSCEA